MEFIDREEELEMLELCYRKSREMLYPVAVMGLRRVGKTRLVFEFIRDKRFVYFYVNPNKRSLDLLNEFSGILARRLSLPSYVAIRDWSSFIEVLLEFGKGWVIVFDEFQYFKDVAPEVFGEFQKWIDLKHDTPMMIIFIGSMIGLMKDIFENKARPLYDRVKIKMKVKAFPFRRALLLMEKLDIKSFEDMARLYLLFGGYPKYYVSIMDLEVDPGNRGEIIRELFLTENAPFRNEGRILLGDSERRVYYSIIEAIALGNRKLSDIASYTGIKQTQLPQYLDDLVYDLEVLLREQPVTAGPMTRRSLYYIMMPVMEFWFRYLHRNWSLLELGLEEELLGIIKKDIENLLATRFEFLVREFIIDLAKDKRLPIEPRKIGRWWRKKYEIDILVMGKNKPCLAITCRWGRLSLKKALEEIEKTKNASSHIEVKVSNISYGIIARKLERKEELRELGYLAYDLEDMEKFYMESIHQEANP